MFTYHISADVHAKERGAYLVDPFKAEITKGYPKELTNKREALYQVMAFTAKKLAEDLNTTIGDLSKRDIDLDFKNIEVLAVH